ncbi:unnamed protein product [Closterium sp. NIES-54]
MTTLRVLLHVAAQRDYELHSLDFSTAFLQGSLHKEIWLRRRPGFTGSFPPGTQWSLRRPVYGLRQAPREWHDTLRTTLAALGFAPSSADPSLFLRTDTSLPLFYILVYVDDLVFATADTAGLAHVKSELQKRHTCTDLGELRSYLGLQITRDRAQRTITLTQSHMVQQVLQRFDFTYSSPQATPLSVHGPTVVFHCYTAYRAPRARTVFLSAAHPWRAAFFSSRRALESRGGFLLIAPPWGQRDALPCPSCAPWRATVPCPLRALGRMVVSSPGGARSALCVHCQCFFRDRTTLTPLSRPVAVSLADPSGGPVLASFSTVLPCPAAPSGADLQDQRVDQFTPASQRVTHCTCARTGRHLATFTRRPGLSLYTLSTESPPVSASGQVAASGSGPESAPCSCRLLSHQTLLWHHRLGHPSLPRLRGMASRVLFPPTEAPLQTLHMDVWGPARIRGQGHERYFLLVVDDYSRYTTVFPLRSKGEVTEVLIDWIRAARLRLRESFGSD